MSKLQRVNILSFVFFLICSISFADSEPKNNKIEDDILGKSIQIDTTSQLSEEKIKEVKDYIAYMEALLKKNNVGFSKQALAKKSTIDKEIKEKLEKLKAKVKEREEAIKSAKTKSLLLKFGIGGVIVFLIPTILSVLVIRNNKKSKQKNTELAEKNEEVERAYSDIKSSLNYANRIQNSVLLKKEKLNELVSESFILHQPKDEVSGDFYFFAEIDNKIIISIVDCTSEGVAGGFLTMMWLSFINETVKKEKILEADKILSKINQKVQNSLSTNADVKFEDGMDMAVLVYDKTTKKAEFSAAAQNLFFTKKFETIKIKGDAKIIGLTDVDYKFSKTEIDIEEGSVAYMSTSGVINMLGEQTQKRFSEDRVLSLLRGVNKYDLATQEGKIKSEINTWKGEFEQTEDVLILGVKF